MDYLIVQYAPFVIAAVACGFLVGWWAQGSRRRLRAAEKEAPLP